MTIATMASYFDLLQDKYGSTYYTDAEKSLFLQRAHIEFIKELFPVEDRSNTNAELSQDTISQIAPLIYEIPYTNMNSSGVITKAAVQAALTAMSATALVWRPLAIGWELGASKKPLKYLRHNDRWEFADNYFKRADSANPKIRETYTSYIVEPVSVSAKVYFTLLKYPAVVDITGGVSSDLPDFTHDRIVAIALELAGVASRDAALAQLLQLKKNG